MRIRMQFNHKMHTYGCVHTNNTWSSFELNQMKTPNSDGWQSGITVHKFVGYTLNNNHSSARFKEAVWLGE